MFKKQIKKGMKFLDEKVPGWEHRIDLDELDIANCTRCMLGQLFGDYGRITRDGYLFEVLSRSESASLGFTVGSFTPCILEDRSWHNLTDEWVDAIDDKLELSKV